MFKRKSRSKKLLAICGILVLAAASISGALAVLPHSHGHDLVHSQHKTCPVHQASAHILHFSVLGISLIFVAFFAGQSLNTKPFFVSSPHLNRSFLRAPPISL
jgi:hypothetical protein